MWEEAGVQIFNPSIFLESLPFPSPGDLPNPGIEPVSPALQADSLLSELPEKPLVYLHVPLFLSAVYCSYV